jgi:UDP-N-acetylmuramoyl-tripeptide--D-alanyl-D-alanine ligase
MSDGLWQGYQVAAATGGEIRGSEDFTVRGLSIDSRTTTAGDLFIALQAERDGHDFVAGAFEKGAVAALVSRPVEAATGPQVIVPDTLKALVGLAEAARDRNFGHRVGVTGSAGKTTTKEMLALALSPLGEVHAAVRSFNNHIGVPLTLSAFRPTAKAGVFEMGMNHAGEIRALTTIVRPHTALITTIAAAHLEFLGSMEAIADAKAEIAEGLVKGGGMILPADSPYLERLEARVVEAGVQRILTFGRSGKDAVLKTVSSGEAGLDVEAEVRGEAIRFTLSARGEHMASNALAAILAATEAGVAPADAAAALSSFSMGEGRGETYRLRIDGKTVTILDESYNANPASMKAALGVLREAKGRRVAVLGEMRELGPMAPELHADLSDACEQSADLVLTAGSMMKHLQDALPAALRGPHEESAEALLQPLLNSVNEADTILLKGSNASRVGALVGALLKSGQRL